MTTKEMGVFKWKMFLQGIESDKQKFEAYINKRGYIENLGQAEYRIFLDKVNSCEELNHAEKANLATFYVEMLNNL